MTQLAPHAGTPFGRNRLLQGLALGSAVLWIAGGLQPLDRGAWLLENLLVFAWVGLLVATHRRFVFSNLSYVLMVLFLLLHVVGSHYTYSAVPFGFWLRDTLGLDRNPYDRLVHFAFGLLLVYPVREWVLRAMHVHGFWSYGVPVLVILALSSAYEIVESWAARIADPELGIAFLGAQGDIWDGQKDMSLALSAAILAMWITRRVRRRTGHEPYLLGHAHAAGD